MLENISPVDPENPLPIPIESRSANPIRIGKMMLYGTGCGICLLIILIAFAYPLREMLFYLSPTQLLTGPVSDENSIRKEIVVKQKRIALFEKRIQRLTPNRPYLIVNTMDNYFYLKKGSETIREGLCSTGSYILLKSHDQREWIFKTPRGMFQVQNKLTSPIWRMPDWAFIEDGKPVPPPNAAERFARGVLGDYALSIGHGYLIHGTLYKRFLGLPVTHGCVRLNDEDLYSVYRNLQPGSKVFIY